MKPSELKINYLYEDTLYKNTNLFVVIKIECKRIRIKYVKGMREGEIQDRFRIDSDKNLYYIKEIGNHKTHPEYFI